MGSTRLWASCALLWSLHDTLRQAEQHDPCRYESLRVNLPRQVMSFSDFPFIPAAIPGGSKDARWYPHHTEVQAWLERFAETFGLLDVIQFRRRVVWAEPAWEGDA